MEIYFKNRTSGNSSKDLKYSVFYSVLFILPVQFIKNSLKTTSQQLDINYLENNSKES